MSRILAVWNGFYGTAQFRKHKYLLDSKIIDNFSEGDIREYLYKNFNDGDAVDGFRFLSEMLNHFQKKVIVLVDEYDSLVNGILYNNLLTEKDLLLHSPCSPKNLIWYNKKSRT